MTRLYQIVGQKYAGIDDPKLPGIEPGAEAFLVREPNNPTDPNAVQVWVGGKRVGYIPKKDNQVLAQFIDQSGVEMALDSNTTEPKVVKAIFRRSANSGYPHVEV